MLTTLIALSKWKDGGRGEVSDCGNYLLFDCWGLSRFARVKLFNLPLLNSRAGKMVESFDARVNNYNSQKDDMVEVETPVKGCIAALVSRGGVCAHVALVVKPFKNSGMLNILEIGDFGVRHIPLSRFINDNRNRVVKYYVDKNIS